MIARLKQPTLTLTMMRACTRRVRELQKHMPLLGNSLELSLADLILIKALDPHNHRLSLSGPSWNGLISIEASRDAHVAS